MALGRVERDSEESKAWVLGEQVRLLYHNPPDVPINLINAVIACATLRQFYPTGVLALWLALFCFVNLVRSWMRHQFALRGHTPERALVWGKLFTLNAFITACLWGLLGSILLLRPDPTYRLFIIFLLGGTMAGGIVSTASYEPAMFAFLVPTVAPAIISLVVAGGGAVPIEMAVMLSLFTVALTLAGRSINRSIVQNLRLRISQGILLRKLRTSETAMAEAQALAHVGSFQLDLRTKVFTGSVEAYRIFEFDPASLLASYETVFAHVHPDDREMVQGKVTTAVATGLGHEIYHRIVRDSGEVRYVHEITKVNCDAKGNAQSFVGIIEDITERRQGEAAKAQLASIVDSSIDAIASETLDGTITSWNRSAERLYGYVAKEIVSRNVRILTPDDRRKEIDDNLATLAKGRSVDPFDTERMRKDGTRIAVSIAVSAILDANGTATGGAFIARDITERNQIARELAYRGSLLHAVTVGTGILVEAKSVRQGMAEALRTLGESMNVDRVLVLQEPGSREEPPILRYVWQAKGITDAFNFSAFSPSVEDHEALAAWRSKLNDGKPISAQRTSSWGPGRAMLEHFGSQSTVIVPIFVSKKLWGSLAVDSCSVAREWTMSETETMKTFGDMAGALIVQNETLHSLESSEERFRVLTATAQDAIITTDKAGLIQHWNLAAERILGYTAEEAFGKQVHQLLAPASRVEEPDPGLAWEGGKTGKTMDLTVVRKDGTEIEVELSVSGATVGGNWLTIGILRDITERRAVEAQIVKSKDAAELANRDLKAANETIKRLARVDELTGLANRRALDEALKTETGRARRLGKGLCLIMGDLDHFKSINDVFGHLIGDDVLIAAASIFISQSRSYDLAARFGGEEFILLLPETMIEEAITIAERIREKVETMRVPTCPKQLTISLGVASWKPGETPERFVAVADAALYVAKNAGRNLVRAEATKTIPDHLAHSIR